MPTWPWGLEHHPDDPEQYRLSVRHAEWHAPSREYREKLMEVMLPEVFWTAYKVYVGASQELGRITFYDIAEDEAALFLERMAEEMRGAKERLEALEQELRPKVPGTRKVTVRDIFMAAPGVPVNDLDEAARFVAAHDAREEEDQ